MEAIRERPLAQPAHLDNTQQLPPPPAPFPVDLLVPESCDLSAPLASHLDRRYAATPGPLATQRNLSSVQTSGVAALTSLLPAGDNARQISTLSAADSRLAAALTDLLETTYELDGLESSPAYGDDSNGDSGLERGSGQDDFAVLAEHLDDLVEGNQLQSPDGQDTIGTLRERLLWERVSTLSHVVKVLIETRAYDIAESPDREGLQENGHERLGETNGQTHEFVASTSQPPDYQDDHHLPSYRPRESISSDYGDDEKSSIKEQDPASTSRNGDSAGDEKRMRELDDLTTAIERLGQAAPRYADQRSELRPRSRPAPQSPGQGSAENGQQQLPAISNKDKMKELEEIWLRIERAHGKRRMRDQDADLQLVGNRRKESREQYLQDLYDRAEASRMSNQDADFREVDSELDKARLLRQRGKFLQHLVESSADTRLSDQDATSPAERRQDFVSDLVERSAAARMASQDYPVPAADRMKDRKDTFMDSLMEYSSSGRLVGQDSNPPTPRVRDGTQQEVRTNPFDLVTAEDFLKNLPSAPLNGQSNIAGASNGKRRSTSEWSIAEEGKEREKEKSGSTSASGTLRRIKGMVKNKSISLGLSKSPTDAIDALNFVAEYHENLNSVAFMLHGSNLSFSSEITLTTTGSSTGSREAILKIGSSSAIIRLPAPMRPSQYVTLTPSNGANAHLEGKLAALPSTSGPPMLGTRYPLSASDLRGLEPTGICCAACDRIVASLSPSQGAGAWKDLPSEHWAEMIEIWMCHQDPTWTSKLAKHTEEGFWPDKGGLLVGGSYLLVNKDDIRRANMVYTQGKDSAWDSLSCLCGEALGKARTADGRPGAGTVRLAKWSIALLREDDEYGENVEPIRSPLGVFVTADMLELAQAHASYRFVVRDEDTEEKRILIWLFNPSLTISYRQASPSPAPSPLRASFVGSSSSQPPGRVSGSSSMSRRSSVTSAKSLTRSTSADVSATSNMGAAQPHTQTQTTRVCKIMYHVLEKGEQFRPPGFGPPPGANQPNVPTSQLQVEDLRYPGQVCERLVRSLRASTDVYPVGARRMGVWDVGFLQRE